MTSLSDPNTEMIHHARRMEAEGRVDQAARLYRQVLEDDQRNAICIDALARIEGQQGDYGKSLELHKAAIDAADGVQMSAHCHASQGMTLASKGKTEAAIDSFMQALSYDPRHVPSHLALGGLWLDAMQPELAAEHYHLSLTISPDLEHLPGNPNAPPALSRAVTRGLGCLRRRFVGLHREVLAEFEDEHGEPALARVRACLEIQHGQRKPEWADPLQKPASVFVPGLPARPWYERNEIRGVAALEADFFAIRDEMMAVLSQHDDRFVPYVHAGPGVPQEMQNLAGKKDWNAFHLYKEGRRIEENCMRCPQTLAAVEKMEMPRCYGNAPEVFFSVLRPGAHIRPHHGVANSKLAVHLALLIPDHCALRAGAETRKWIEGQCLVFDDSFEHEAWNRSDSPRTVLILEVWHPDLSEIEREALGALCNAIETWARPVVSKWLAPGDNVEGSG